MKVRLRIKQDCFRCSRTVFRYRFCD